MRTRHRTRRALIHMGVILTLVGLVAVVVGGGALVVGVVPALVVLGVALVATVGLTVVANS